MKDSALWAQEKEGLYGLCILGKKPDYFSFSSAFTNTCECSNTIVLTAVYISHVCELVQRIECGNRNSPYLR